MDDVVYEWDPIKAAQNLSKHRVSFAEAATVFEDPFAVTFEDPDHSDREQRSVTLGSSHAGRILFVAHTDREGMIRIISARRATRRESHAYEEGSF
jgi:uncharacterized DUF497 family protein